MSTTLSTDEGRWWWLKLLAGLAAIAVGVAAFAWPEATVRVVGFLFGLHLLVTGTVRALVLPFLPEYPGLYRVLGTALGVLTAVVGVICLLNLVGSAVLLVLVIGIGWLLDGLMELFLGLSRGTADADRGWRIAAGLAYVLAALAVLAWPKLSLSTFLAVGALFLIIVGVAQVAGAVVAARGAQARGHEGPAHG
jgi:uncharacterized membrane protein HdeD (DUF308 family)